MSRIPICNCHVASWIGGYLLFSFFCYYYGIPDFYQIHNGWGPLCVAILLLLTCVLAARNLVYGTYNVFKLGKQDSVARMGL
jgi:hypothetical protein